MAEMYVQIATRHGLWMFPLMMLALGVLLSLFVLFRKKAKSVEEHLQRVKDMLERTHSNYTLEENVNRFLELVAELIDAPTYAFYMIDKKNRGYVLKAVRYEAKDFGDVRPSYSGLASFQEGTYRPPISLPASKKVYAIAKTIEGEIPLYEIPVGEKAIIQVGPLENVPKRVRRTLEVVCGEMVHLLDNFAVTENFRTQAEIVVSSGKALQKVSNISMNAVMLLEMIVKLCIRSMQAAGGCFVRQAGGGYGVPVAVGLDEATRQQLKEDADTLSRLHERAEKETMFFLDREDPTYYDLPSYVAAAGMETLHVIKMDLYEDCFFILWYEEGKRDIEGKTTALRVMIDNLNGIMRYQAGLRQFSDAYLEILKMLARLLDNLSPYTVGYSELMSRYSVAIAKKLGLGEEETKEIAVAAYLSNIGVLGLSSELFEKEGKYSDEEYELMKLHAEVGASVINVATGNERIASYVMYHHERMDGNGYPEGLKGEEIPIGARIIGVVQTFLAKINGRKYREPLPFDDALQLLRSAAGSQLDSQIVDAFIEWFDEKRSHPPIPGRSLGACWEMLCVPSGICEQCPVYKNRDVHCWEVEDNLCKAHGKNCETCMVRTEYITRKETAN